MRKSVLTSRGRIITSGYYYIGGNNPTRPHFFGDAQVPFRRPPFRLTIAANRRRTVARRNSTFATSRVFEREPEPAMG